MKKLSFYWDITNSPYESPFMNGSQKFGVEKPIFLIDQFQGKRPMVFNEEFMMKGEIGFPMFPSAMLDSNIANAIDRFVEKGVIDDGLSSLLAFLTSKHWDFSLMFYYFEHRAKSTLEDFKVNAIRRTRSLITLHSMDGQHYLRTGEIIPCQRSVDDYLTRFNSGSIGEVAEKRVQDFIHDYKPGWANMQIEAVEIALMKMVLIRCFEKPKSGPIKQYEEFIRFLVEDLDLYMGREAYLAMHYFSNSAGKLLGIQPNTRFEKAISVIRKTAWDICLLRMPETVLTESPKELSLCYVATYEKDLSNIANLFSIEGVFGSPEGIISPTISYDISLLPDEIKVAARDHELPKRLRLDALDHLPIGLHQSLLNELTRRLS